MFSGDVENKRVPPSNLAIFAKPQPAHSSIILSSRDIEIETVAGLPETVCLRLTYELFR